MITMNNVAFDALKPKTLTDLPNEILLAIIPKISFEGTNYVALFLTNRHFHDLLSKYELALTQMIVKEQFLTASFVSRSKIYSIPRLYEVRLQTTTVESIIRCYKNDSANFVRGLRNANLQTFVVGLHLWPEICNRPSPRRSEQEREAVETWFIERLIQCLIPA
jgi:hypothetical protein